MQQITVLITGITGFLGSHIGEVLFNSNYKIIATKRTNSNLDNCSSFNEYVEWINIDSTSWQQAIINHQPQIIIHAAWIGVTADEREDWEKQSQNITFLHELLYIAQKCSTKKIIGLGSQAEYGYINSQVNEQHTLKPTNAYGAVKIIASQLVKHFAQTNNIQWFWLRVFSVFGERESATWLLPSVIKKILQKQVKAIQLSPGEQQYAYLYIQDFAKAIKSIVENDNKDCNGIYNISSNNPMPLKSILTYVKDAIDTSFMLDFGALPYRENQSMIIAGDASKFEQQFGIIANTSFEQAIKNTINYYTSKQLNESI